ncbi:MAG: LEA type 2 family protein [Planctomycetota bacterium]
MRTKGFAVMLLGALWSVVMGGCTGATAPTFRVLDASLTSETDEGYVVTFTLEGENTNGFELPLREVDYRLVLEGEEVFTGRRSAEVTLAADSRGVVTLPVSVAFGEGVGLPASMAYELSGRVTYVLPGAIAELLFDNQIRKPRVGFGERGVLEGG